MELIGSGGGLAGGNERHKQTGETAKGGRSSAGVPGSCFGPAAAAAPRAHRRGRKTSERQRIAAMNAPSGGTRGGKAGGWETLSPFLSSQPPLIQRLSIPSFIHYVTQ